ncbi:MAG: eukaryotic-like serine/threonine-protein kinase [Mycobacterium sp.]|jgi:hypothetical protein|uniref:sensor domain-containing protein n=1 Tax=Mycobacterium sp. TaxID=1785 RepID=UPI0028BB7B75|nr:sensor domain-containing protein [Mycobacterium sp.]MDT5119853.1 eukaryotic-like serine/threonine-protein kinase [Mycobacterium sp.]
MSPGGYRPDPFGGNPFDASPYGASPGGQSLGPSAGPPPTPSTGRPANVLATLSLVFAFLFAPAGLVLGHLGLKQIRRTGQRGHDRALVGVTLSYAITVTAVAALVAWLATDSQPAPVVAGPSTHSSTAPTTASSAPTAQPAPGPVTEHDLPPFLLSLDEVKTMVRNPNLVVAPPLTAPSQAPYVPGTTIEPANCAVTQFAGTALAYEHSGYRSMYQVTMSSAPAEKMAYSVTQSVAVFTDAAAAQKASDAYVKLWNACGDGVIDWKGDENVRWRPIGPTGLGLNPTVENFSNVPIPEDYNRSISRNFYVKANVLVDIAIFGDHNWDYPMITTILNRIPG